MPHWYRWATDVCIVRFTSYCKIVRGMDMNLVLWIRSTSTQTKVLVLTYFYNTPTLTVLMLYEVLVLVLRFRVLAPTQAPLWLCTGYDQTTATIDCSDHSGFGPRLPDISRNGFKQCCLPLTESMYPEWLWRSFWVWAQPVRDWTQDWVGGGVFEILRPAFETGFRLMKQSAHSWKLLCCQSVSAPRHVLMYPSYKIIPRMVVKIILGMGPASDSQYYKVSCLSSAQSKPRMIFEFVNK